MKLAPIKSIFPKLDIIPGIACMMLMVQAYLIAPLSRTLEKDFDSSLINLAIPAFALPFAIAASLMVFIKPSFDLRKCMLFSLAILSISTFMLSKSASAEVFLLIRMITGIGTGMMLPAALVLAVRPQREKPNLNYMALIIFALAIGMTFGPSLGGWLNRMVGWRSLYVVVGTLAAILFCIYLIGRLRSPFSAYLAPYDNRKMLLGSQNRTVNGFIYLTGLFHSGVFVWISHYFVTHYQLDEFHIATDLFIFGLPGLLVSMLMHFYYINKKITTILYLTFGLTISGLLILMGNLPLWLAECLLGVMSVGFGCSQPLFIGILEIPSVGFPNIAPVAKGSAILFAGYGSGPLFLIVLLKIDLGVALTFLVILVLLLAYLARHIWRIPIPKAFS